MMENKLKKHIHSVTKFNERLSKCAKETKNNKTKTENT